MTDLTPNHPAVEAAARSAYERTWRCECEHWSEVDDLERDAWRANKAHSLTAALPHLTADDLRHTPAGRALMAEAWDQAVAATDRAWNHAYDDHPVNPDSPYYECTSCDTTNPYLEGDA